MSITTNLAAPRLSSTIAVLVITEICALGSLVMPILVGLSVKVASFDLEMKPESALALVTAIGAAAAMAASPVFGRLSDRRRHEPGGRSPWLWAGSLTGAVAVGAVALAPDLTTLTIAWVLAQVCFNSTFAALYGLIADLVPEEHRALVSGWFGTAVVMSIAVSMGFVALAPDTGPWLFAPMPILAVLSSGYAAWFFRRAHAADDPARAPRLPWSAMFSFGQFTWVFVQRLLVQLAYSIGVSFGFFFLIRRIGMDVEGATRWVSLVTVVTCLTSAAASVVVGRLAARTGSYGPWIVAAMVLLCAGLTVKGLGQSLAAYVAAGLIVAFGIGLYYAVDVALVLRTTPMQSAGQFLGVYNIARTLPQSLAPAIAPLLLAIGAGDVIGDGPQNYFALYLTGALLALVALIPLKTITVLRRADDLPTG